MGETATVGWGSSSTGQSPATPAWHRLARQTNHWLGKVGFSVCRTATLAELRAAKGSLDHTLAEHQALKHRLSELDRQLAPTVNARFPVYLIDGSVPAAAPSLGASPHPLVVCTIPKSGTYLVSELLERLGCVPTRLHLSRHSLTDYRFASLREAREEYERFQVDLRLENAVKLLLPGQFAVGHLECSSDVRDCLGRAKKIFTYRDLRDGLVSYMRFLASTGRGGDRTAQWKDLPAGPDQMLAFLDQAGHEFFGQSLPLLGWVDDADVLKLSFESIYGDHGPTEQQQAIDRLHSFLELPGPVPGAADLVRSILGTPTITWSGGRARRETYWNGEVERRFVDFGGAEANVRLGYDNK